MATKQQDAQISVMEVQRGEIEFCVLGSTPLICNRMSEKVKRELLMPAGKKTAADKASNLKHNPMEEFRASPYTLNDEGSPTLLALMSSAFKGALRTAALDMPGAKKAQIGRLTWVEGMYTPVYGIPQLFMSVTRSADMNKTPDVRTRAIIPEWACRVTISFVKPILREQVVANLFAAAGITMGVGDWRTEKGAGNFGQFRLVSRDDKDFLRIVKAGGRRAQSEAMKAPQCYDTETEEMLSWFDAEAKRRGHKVPSGLEIVSNIHEPEAIMPKARRSRANGSGATA